MRLGASNDATGGNGSMDRWLRRLLSAAVVG
jgi:hypothetical protein